MHVGKEQHDRSSSSQRVLSISVKARLYAVSYKSKNFSDLSGEIGFSCEPRRIQTFKTGCFGSRFFILVDF